MAEVINSNPTVLEQWQLPTRELVKDSIVSELAEADHQLEQFSLSRSIYTLPDTLDEELLEAPSLEHDSIDPQEIYDLISSVSDPEHPLTLGQLAVVSLDRITIEDNGPNKISHVTVEITPTITHCSLATLIGLGVRVRLERCLPPRFRIHINVTPGSHQSEEQVNKQLNDKERVAAACENQQLLNVISQMLSTCITETNDAQPVELDPASQFGQVGDGEPPLKALKALKSLPTKAE